MRDVRDDALRLAAKCKGIYVKLIRENAKDFFRRI